MTHLKKGRTSDDTNTHNYIMLNNSPRNDMPSSGNHSLTQQGLFR